MNFFGGKKERKSSRAQKPSKSVEYKPFDFGSLPAFSDAELAKMGGVDTLQFDENDPDLMEELRSMGYTEEGAGSSASKARPGAHRPSGGRGGDRGVPGGAVASPVGEAALPSSDEIMASLGLGTGPMKDPVFTEADMRDPELLRELGEVSGDPGMYGQDEETDEDEGTAGGYPGAVGREAGKGYAGAGTGMEQEEDDDDDEDDEDEGSGNDGGHGGAESEDSDGIDPDELLRYESMQPPSKSSLPSASSSRSAPDPGPPPYDMSRRSAPPPYDSSMPAGVEAQGRRQMHVQPGPAAAGSSAADRVSMLEKERKQHLSRAKALRDKGDMKAAMEALRRARNLETELSSMQVLQTTQRVATVTTDYVPSTPPVGADGHQDPNEQEEEQEEQGESGVAPPPSSSSSRGAAGARGGGRKLTPIEKRRAEVKVLEERAVALKAEGRVTEAMECLKRSKLLKGTIGEGPNLHKRASEKALAGDQGRRASTRSQAAAKAPAPALDTNQAQVFPGKSDLFSDLEKAIAAAIKMHQGRAKTLAKKDRAAAMKEVRRYKELQKKLDLVREMRVVPGARPPQWGWRVTKKNRVRTLDQVPMDQIEFEISRVHGMAEKTDCKGAIYIKYDLGYSKDEKIGKGTTHSYRVEGDTVNVEFKVQSYIKRARSTQLAFQNRRVSLDIMHKAGMFSSSKLVGKCLVQLQPLLKVCELAVSSPILTEGRREAGGTVELCLRLRKPISSDEVVTYEEKELEIGEWPDPMEPSSAPAPAPAAAPSAATPVAPKSPVKPRPVPSAAKPAPPPGPAPHTAPSPVAAPSAAAPAGDEQAAPKRPPKVVLTDSEKSDPFAVEHLDSNNVLEHEIASCSAKADNGELDAVMRKGALETKLLMLVSAVQSGELDLSGYCDILKDRVSRDKVLALHLKGEGRTKEAVAVMRRIRVMEEELAGVPQEEAGEEA